MVIEVLTNEMTFYQKFKRMNHIKFWRKIISDTENGKYKDNLVEAYEVSI